MANRSFQSEQYCLIKRKVEIYAAVAVAGAGAVTLKKWVYPSLAPAASTARTYVTATSASALPSGNPYPLQYNAGAEGVRSVTRTATGAWTIKLQDNYQRVMGVSFNTSVAGGAATVVVVSRNTSVDSMTAAGGSEFGILFSSAAATAADPASGDVILLTFVLQDATEP